MFDWAVFLALIHALDKPEVIASSVIGIAVGFIALNQYYGSKRQWFVMQQGIVKTESLLEQNKEMIAAVKTQSRQSEIQAGLMDKHYKASPPDQFRFDS